MLSYVYILRRSNNMKGFILGVLLTLAVVFPDKTKDAFDWTVEKMQNVFASSESTVDKISSKIEERKI